MRVALGAAAILAGSLTTNANAAPPQKVESGTQFNEDAVAKSLNNLSETVSKKSMYSEPGRPCIKGKEDRGSDPCAQWTAVDTAVESVVWTERSFYIALLGTIIGFTTLGSAIAAALFAKKAADETKRSADIAEVGIDASVKAARVAAQVDLPIIVLSKIQADHYRIGSDSGRVPEAPMHFTLTFTNYGRTPAIMERFYLSHYAGSHTPPPPILPPDGDSLPMGTVGRFEIRRALRVTDMFGRGRAGADPLIGLFAYLGAPIRAGLAPRGGLSASGGRGPPVKPGAALEIIDQVGHADADVGAGDADRAHDEMHAMLLASEDMLDCRSHC